MSRAYKQPFCEIRSMSSRWYTRSDSIKSLWKMAFGACANNATINSYQYGNCNAGAPALQLPYWYELIVALFAHAPKAIFHSDLMLSERVYQREDIERISQKGCLYALDIKGTNEQEWLENTRKPLNEELLWKNLRVITRYGDPACFYFTFTGCKKQGIEQFLHKVSPSVDPRL